MRTSKPQKTNIKRLSDALYQVGKFSRIYRHRLRALMIDSLKAEKQMINISKQILPRMFGILEPMIVASQKEGSIRNIPVKQDEILSDQALQTRIETILKGLS